MTTYSRAEERRRSKIKHALEIAAIRFSVGTHQITGGWTLEKPEQGMPILTSPGGVLYTLSPSGRLRITR